MADGERTVREAAGRAEDRALAARPSLPAYLPRLLVYPLRGNGLGFLLVFTPILYFSVLAGVFGIWALVVFGAWTVSYVFTCTERTADGRALPPVIEYEQLNPFDARLGASLVYFAALAALPPAAAAYLGDAAQPVLIVALALALPAHLVRLGALREPMASLNPVAVARTAAALGANGLVAAGVAAVACVAAGAVFTSSLLAGFAATLYALVLTGHAAGFAAFHASERLGLAGPEIDNDDTAAERALNGLVEAMLAYDGRGEREQALACFEAPADWVAAADPVAVQVNALRRVHANGRRQLARACGRVVLARLLDWGRTVQAAELLAELRELDPARLAADARRQRALAEAAASSGRAELGLDVLADLDGETSDPDTGRAAVAKAWLLADRGREDEARALAEQLRRSLGTLLDPELERLQTLLRRLTSGNGRNSD